MINSLKAEFRKLLTVRSTYIIMIISFLLSAVLIGFWIYGYKNVEHADISNGALSSAILAAVSTVGVFLSFVVILLVGHEYRYNTITYSLTSVNQRAKLFFAKYVALLAFAFAFTAFVAVSLWAMFYVGLSVAHVTPLAQHIDAWSVLWRSVVTIVGDISFAFIIVMILRSLIGAIAVVLLLPTTIESLLSLLLKDNTKYLPYTALGSLTNTTNAPGVTFGFSMAVVACYAIVGMVIAYLLFQKRDAN